LADGKLSFFENGQRGNIPIIWPFGGLKGATRGDKGGVLCDHLIGDRKRIFYTPLPKRIKSITMMRILRIFYIGLAVGILAMPDLAKSEPSVPPSPSEDNPAPEYVPLRDALPQISEQTGIQFQVPEELLGEMISLQENGEASGSYSMDWLRDYNHIEIVDEQSGQRKIILMRRGTSGSPEISKGPASRRTIQANKPVQGEPHPTLSREKLLELAQDPYGSRIPTEFYEDDEYRVFFSAFGVRSAEDLKNWRKVKRIKQEARKLLYKTKPQ